MGCNRWDISKKLTMQKRQCLLEGGRLALIRSTISSLLIYWMSLLVILRKVILRLEKIERDFLQRGGALEKNHHLVKESIVCRARKEVDLGIKNPFGLNIALLDKQGWRFALEQESPRIILVLGNSGNEEISVLG